MRVCGTAHCLMNKWEKWKKQWPLSSMPSGLMPLDSLMLLIFLIGIYIIIFVISLYIFCFLFFLVYFFSIWFGWLCLLILYKNIFLGFTYIFVEFWILLLEERMDMCTSHCTRMPSKILSTLKNPSVAMSILLFLFFLLSWNNYYYYYFFENCIRYLKPHLDLENLKIGNKKANLWF